MKWIRAHCHIVDHPRFTDAGVLGRDLWHWGMLFAGKHETDGEIPTSALLASAWGAGGKRNATVARKLVEVGLWEQTEAGYRICRWSEMGNPTKADLAEKRKEEREGRKERRTRSSAPPPSEVSSPVVSADVSAPDNQKCPPRTPDGVPYSYSEGLTGRKDPEVSRGPASSADPMQPPPDWWAGVLATIHSDCGVTLPGREAWLRYAGHRVSKSQREGRPYPATQPDALHWLAGVMVPEARKERRAESDKRERDAKWDRQRSGPASPGEGTKLTEAEAKSFADQLRQRMAARNKGAA